MFDIWTSSGGGDGLGDTKTCEQVVQEQLARGYVFAATALAWSGKGYARDIYFKFTGLDKAKLESAIQNDLASNGFYAIRVDTETPILSTGPGTKFRIWVTTPIDFNSLNDVQSLISGIVGNHATNVQDVTTSVRQIPPMCAGSPVMPSPGTQAPTTPAPDSPGAPGSGKCAGRTGLDSIACELGLTSGIGDILQWLVIGVLGAVVIKTVIK